MFLKAESKADAVVPRPRPMRPWNGAAHKPAPAAAISYSTARSSVV
jgi:hypothetical protein